MKVTVWCVLWGEKYGHYYPQRLKREVAKYLTIPHEFKCLSNQTIDGVETVPQVTDKPGWWQKLDLFSPGVPDYRNLYLDLDVVITGSLDVLVEEYSNCALATPWNWAQSGYGGCQSSVMLWHSSGPLPIWQAFDPAIAHWPPINSPPILWGDQEFITTQRDAGFPVTQIAEKYVKSYKYHCRENLPDDCRVVVFHGNPKPADVREEWFKW